MGFGMAANYLQLNVRRSPRPWRDCPRILCLQLTLVKFLQMGEHAAAELERKHSLTLAVPPSEEVQRQHELTHTPYQPWCESYVCFKARVNRQLRDDSSRASETATVPLTWHSQGLFLGANPQDVSVLLSTWWPTALYVGVPLRSKGQFELMTQWTYNAAAT